MKSAINKAFLFASYGFPRAILARTIHFPLLAPFYHLVSDDHPPHIKYLFRYRTIAEFKRDIEFFLQDYHPISLDEILLHIRTGKALSRKSFFLSFDDGLREIHEVIAPILKEKGIPATFFVTTATLDNADMIYRHKASLIVDQLMRVQQQNIAEVKRVLGKRGIYNDDLAAAVLGVKYRDREVLDDVAQCIELDLREYLARRRPYASTGEIKKLISEGFTIGAHSVDHPFYPELPVDDQLRQTNESLEIVTRLFGLSYRAFAFPFGDNGVPKRFFNQVLAENAADVLFGSSSSFWNDEYYPFAVQRLGMESGFHRAADNLRVAEIKFGLRVMIGRSNVRRSSGRN